MDNSKSVVPSGAYGIPKWIMKKGMRYEVDDFIVSPPSLDDGGFLRLRYGRTLNTDAATHGHGQDVGMTVEVKDDTLQFSSEPPPPTTTISIGPGGFSVESTPTTTPLTTPESTVESPPVHPLLVLPMNFGGEPKFVMKVDSTHSPNTNKDSFGSTASAQHQDLNTKSLEALDTHTTQLKLFEKVKTLAIINTPSHSAVSSPAASPFTTPKTSPTSSRKLLNLNMEPQRKISAHSYFCTKQFQDNEGNLGGVSKYNNKDIISSVNNKREEVAIPPQALDPKMMGQRRRQPKPSTLREMNFWAPTSM